MEGNTVLIAFLLTLIAGLCTGIGSLIALFASKTNRKFLSFSLGLSAGVMIYVSFVELFQDAQQRAIDELGTRPGMLVAAGCFFGGFLLIGIIDRLVPKYENPHEMRSVETMNDPNLSVDIRLKRMGLMTALAIGIHNFPEGIATFTSALESPALGMAIAAAIAIHNIPEGIAVSVPVYQATGSKKTAFKYSFLSGLSEPVGALLAYAVLMPFITPFLLGIIFAVVAGIMVFISLDELLPAAREYGEHHIAITGVFVGMIIMAFSLVLFA